MTFKRKQKQAKDPIIILRTKLQKQRQKRYDLLEEWYWENLLDHYRGCKKKKRHEDHEWYKTYQKLERFRIKDISLPHDSTGYVYLFISKQNTKFEYIDQTYCIRSTLLQHNKNFGNSDLPVELRPYTPCLYLWFPT